MTDALSDQSDGAPLIRKRCVNCGAIATREFCYAAEPWVPYCASHEPQYVTAGERAIEDRRRIWEMQ